jgi:hypothetical protein
MNIKIGRLVHVSFVFIALGSVALADAPTPLTPGPEHQKLGYFVGKWSSEGTMAESPFGPGGKVTSKDVCEWFEGKFAVVCKADGSTPTGKVKSIGIMSYSPEEKVYGYYGLDSTGMAMMSVPRGTLTGDTWTYADESMMGGKKIKSRYILKQLSPEAYSFRWEVLGEDGKWTTVVEGKSTKAR